MELLLVRHAIAEDRDAGRWPDDSKRPLTERGRERFAAVARTLRRRSIRPDVLYSSRYVRAWQTAEILNDKAGWPAPVAMPALEFDSSGDIIQAVNDESNSGVVALVGHEPTLGELASTLLAGVDEAMRIDVKKGGVILLDCPLPVRAGEAMLRWYLTPKLAAAGDDG